MSHPYISSLFPFLSSSLYHRIHAHGSPQLPYRNIVSVMFEIILELIRKNKMDKTVLLM